MTESRRYSFSMEPPGHWHVSWMKRLRFRIQDVDGGLPAPALRATVIATRAADGLVVGAPALEEEPGVYAADFTALALSPHAFALRIDDGEATYYSQPWPVEIARDGDEGIRVDAPGTSYVYQIRYDWSPGPLVADDEAKVALSFELMRGVPEGDAIQWKRPWANLFHHVPDAQESRVVIESEGPGAPARDVLSVEYRGLGVYQAHRVFSVAEVGDGRSYEVIFQFVDPYNAALVRNHEPYTLTVQGRR